MADRKKVLLAAKFVVAAALIGWLLRGGALDFAALAILVERPGLLVLDLGLFAFGIVLAALRYRVLLRLVDVKVALPRLFQLQLTAIFFNVVIPGSIGGDVVKALYVARDAPPSSRTTIVLIAFVERLLGLVGLIAIAAVVTAARAPTLWSDPLLRPMALTVLVLAALTLAGGLGFLIVIRRAGPRLEAWTSGGSSKLAKMLQQLAYATRLLASGPKELAAALAISMAMHAAAMAFFTLLTVSITGQDVPYASVATVFPLGILTMALPISPSGLGVAHVAFDRLFAAIGLTGGATVFNVFLLGSIAPSLFGVIPYLALKRRGELPAA